MDPRNRDDRVAGTPGDRDHEIAADAAAMGAAQISRSTGTAGPGSGLAASLDTGIGRTSHAATTGPTTDASDMGEAINPPSAQLGGTGTAGSGLGAADVAGAEPGELNRPTAAGMGGVSGAPGASGEKGTTQGGSDAGGGGGTGGAGSR